MKKIIGYLIAVIILTGGLFFAGRYNVIATTNQQKISPVKNEVRASHILVNSEVQAARIKKEIENNEITFENAAKKYSLCPSAQNGGDLGYFGRNVMVPEFETAAFNLPLGKISNPVKTAFGYHLIKVTGIK